MNRVRYVDKRVLCNYDLREEFFEALGVKISDMIPLRKVFVLFTSEGKKILKITDSSKERINFIDKALKYIENTFPNILQYHTNKNNEIITLWEDQKFILLNMIEGREVAFTNPIEVELCAKSLAMMHNASNGIFNFLNKDEVEANLGVNLLEKFKDELKLLQDIKDIVIKFKYKNEFDIMFLDVVDSTVKDLILTIDILKESPYDELIKSDENIVLCHNDLAHHNFIIDNEAVSIIDFDYCNINLRVMDIYNYTVKVLKSVFYDKNVFDSIVNNYSSISKLELEEIELLKLLLLYPRDIINISRDYYLKQKAWDEEVFISRFKNKIELEEYRKEFLAKL